MRSQRIDHTFEQPELFVVKAQELPLSGHALLDLMRAVLARGKPFRFCARGWSMAPFIHDGDVISISPLQQDRPRIGEVVAFIRPEHGNLVVHRVVSRRGGSVSIQGDNGIDETDGIIPREYLLGRVTRVERKGRNVWLGLGPERIVIAWLSRARLLVPLLNWFVSMLRSFYRRSR